MKLLNVDTLAVLSAWMRPSSITRRDKCQKYDSKREIWRNIERAERGLAKGDGMLALIDSHIKSAAKSRCRLLLPVVGQSGSFVYLSEVTIYQAATPVHHSF